MYTYVKVNLLTFIVHSEHQPGVNGVLGPAGSWRQRKGLAGVRLWSIGYWCGRDRGESPLVPEVGTGMEGYIRDWITVLFLFLVWNEVKDVVWGML